MEGGILDDVSRLVTPELGKVDILRVDPMRQNSDHILIKLAFESVDFRLTFEEIAFECGFEEGGIVGGEVSVNLERRGTLICTAIERDEVGVPGKVNGMTPKRRRRRTRQLEVFARPLPFSCWPKLASSCRN